jgi:hypothetical protein
MAQAKSVLSTPRRTASKILPVSSPEHGVPSHDEAFREMESPMREIYCMAKITSDVATNITRSPENEIVHFAIGRLCEMVCDLHNKYHEDLRAGKAVQS